MTGRYLFTSESVTEGHPDKICAQISDTILDALLSQDPVSRVAAEVIVTIGLMLVTGEITSKSQVNYVDLVRRKIAEIGYTDATNGFCYNSCSVLVALVVLQKLLKYRAFLSISSRYAPTPKS